MRNVETVGQLHSKLHEATGKYVLEARETLRAVNKMQKTNEIRDDLHHEVGQHVQRLTRQVVTMEENHGLYEKLHEATTSKVLGLQTKVGSVKRDVTETRQAVQELSATENLQTEVQVEVSHNLKGLQQQIDTMHVLNEQLSRPQNPIASDPVHGKKHKKMHQRATAEIETPTGRAGCRPVDAELCECGGVGRGRARDVKRSRQTRGSQRGARQEAEHAGAGGREHLKHCTLAWPARDGRCRAGRGGGVRAQARSRAVDV